jgi:hypothetical protein
MKSGRIENFGTKKHCNASRITDQMEHFEAVDERVDFAHETFHEDDFAEADAHVAQFGRKGLATIH